MELPEPIELEGDSYPYAVVSFSTQAVPTDTGTKVSISLRIVPARLVEGTLETREDAARSKLFNSDIVPGAELEITETFLRQFL